jgi:hypothetical protein
MPDGLLLHLRDTYPVETAWAPQWVGDELRQVRDAAWAARLTSLRAYAEADAARRRGDHRHAIQEQQRADSYRALEQAYRQRETVFAAVMTDRAEWEAATRQQRQLAVAADAELRRRHPGQYFAPLRSAEPRPATGAQHARLTLTAGEESPETGQWIRELAAGRPTFADRLANRQSETIPQARLVAGGHPRAERRAGGHQVHPRPAARQARRADRRARTIAMPKLDGRPWVLPFQRRIRPVSAAAATVGVESQPRPGGLTTGGKCSWRSSSTLEKPTAGTAARRDRHARGGPARAGPLDGRGLHLPDGGAVRR